MTVFMTTHLLEEADHADRIAILHEGELVALDKPEALRRELGGDVIAIIASDPEVLLKKLEQHDGLSPQLIDGVIRISGTVNSQLVSDLHTCYHDEVQQISVGKPSLEDVFIARTGHRFWGAS